MMQKKFMVFCLSIQIACLGACRIQERVNNQMFAAIVNNNTTAFERLFQPLNAARRFIGFEKHIPDIHAIDAQGRTAIRCAVETSALRAFNALLTKRPDITKKSPKDNLTDLEWIVRQKSCCPEMSWFVESLIRCGAATAGIKGLLLFLAKSPQLFMRLAPIIVRNGGNDPNEQDEAGRTIIHYLCFTCRIPRNALNAAALLQADFNILDHNGDTPLDIARSRNNALIISELRKHGAKTSKELEQHISRQELIETRKLLVANPAAGSSNIAREAERMDAAQRAIKTHHYKRVRRLLCQHHYTQQELDTLCSSALDSDECLLPGSESNTIVCDLLSLGAITLDRKKTDKIRDLLLCLNDAELLRQHLERGLTPFYEHGQLPTMLHKAIQNNSDVSTAVIQTLIQHEPSQLYTVKNRKTPLDMIDTAFQQEKKRKEVRCLLRNYGAFTYKELAHAALVEAVASLNIQTPQPPIHKRGKEALYKAIKKLESGWLQHLM